MKEADWLGATDPQTMLTFLRRKVSDRKLRLFAVASCSWAEDFMPDPHTERLIALAERFADGLADEQQLEAARSGPSFGWSGAVPCGDAGNPRGHAAERAVQRSAFQAAREVAGHLLEFSPEVPDDAGNEAPVRDLLCALLRDVFGHLFCPALIQPEWLSWADGIVPKLAEAIYEDYAFERLPILADALEEAGCAGPGILEHLRGSGPHMRGCWALDAVLGRE